MPSPNHLVGARAKAQLGVRCTARQAFFPRKTPTETNSAHYTNCTFALAPGSPVPRLPAPASSSPTDAEKLQWKLGFPCKEWHVRSNRRGGFFLRTLPAQLQR